jgi:trans-2,3-dihydro-3-hydroxyanthranilate isomerase
MCAETLGIAANDVDNRFPVQVVSTGIPFVIVPVKSLAAVKRAKPNWTKYVISDERVTPRSILLFCPESHTISNNLSARCFADQYGVPEDPATGSANGCLAGYLVKHRYWGQAQIDVRVEQGYEIDRPSLLFLNAREQNGTIDVKVGGKVVMVAKGELVQDAA